MKQSSIDWLVQQLARKHGEFQGLAFYYDHQDEIKRAKAMHKKEIEQSYYDGIVCSMSDQDADMLKLSEQYYNETFNTK